MDDFAELKQFEIQDRKQFPPEGLILFVGSSTFTRWGEALYRDMAPLKVLNRGFGGSRTECVLYYLDNVVLRYKPKTIVFYEGDNDLTGDKTPEMFLEECREFVRRVREKLPGVKIYFVSIKPSPSRKGLWEKMKKANVMLEKYTLGHEYLAYIDITREMFDSEGNADKNLFIEDLLHMNEKGYKIWTKIIKERLMEDGQ